MIQFQNTLSFAQQLDKEDSLSRFRDAFYLLKKNDKHVIYLCGNSLGLQPKSVKAAIEQELKDWAELGVEGHFDGNIQEVVIYSTDQSTNRTGMQTNINSFYSIY